MFSQIVAIWYMCILGSGCSEITHVMNDMNQKMCNKDIYLFMYLFIYVFIYLCIYLFVYLFIYVFILVWTHWKGHHQVAQLYLISTYNAFINLVRGAKKTQHLVPSK